MIYLFCGQKGNGKTLYTVSFLRKHLKKYDYVFTNFPISFAYKIGSYDWVNSRFPPHSAILIDEAQLYFNSRKFSELTKNGIGVELLDYLTMCRHYDVDIYFITQSADRIDLQIRELSDYVYQIKHTFKIPFFRRPWLVFGLQFRDILEFEKYINPNNFCNQFDSRFTFKFIHHKDLRAFDTNYIDKKYFDKKLINFKKWSEIK